MNYMVRITHKNGWTVGHPVAADTEYEALLIFQEKPEQRKALAKATKVRVANNEPDRILDCGHQPSPHSEHTTGTAHTSDDREICWDCAYQRQIEDMRTAPKYSGYLSSDLLLVTDWTGRKLGRVVELSKRGPKFKERCYFKMIDVNGRRWSGRGEGAGMICNLKRTGV